MYTIKTAEFSLEFTPIGDSILIKVYCDGFSAISYFDAEDACVADFALQLKDMYEKLEGCARIRDLYETDSYLEFVAESNGHILIKGIIINHKRKYTRQLTFEYDIDQTYIHDFVTALAADYSNHAE